MTAVTARARAALVRISDAYLAHQPLTRFDVGQPGHAVRPMHQKALHEAGLIHIGTMVRDDWLIPTDAGRQVVRGLARAAGDPDPYPDLQPPQENRTMTTLDTTTVLDPDTPADDLPAPAPEAVHAQLVAVDDLHPRPDNLRVDADGTELVTSIVRHGILQPLNVTPRDEGGYWINAGHRRHDGARRAGLIFVPCIVSEIETDRDVAFTMLIENLQRRDLNPIEEARGFARLVDLGCNQAEIAEHTGISPSVVSRRLKLLQLPDTAHDQIAAGDLSLELAEAYARLDPEVVEIAVAKGWDSYRVDDALRKAERKAKAGELRDLIREAGIREVPYSQIGKWDDDTHRLSSTQFVTDHTVDAIIAAAEPTNVVGVAISEQAYSGPQIVVVERREATEFEIEQRARQQERAANPDGPSDGDQGRASAQQAAAERRRRDMLHEAREAHYMAWLQGLAGRKWKAADALDLLVAAALLSVAAMDDEQTVDALGLAGATYGWNEKADTFIAAAKGLTGPALTKVVVAIAADLLGYDLYGPPEGEILELAQRFGFEQLPDDHPLDEA